MAFLGLCDPYLLQRLFDDSKPNPENTPFLNVVSEKKEEYKHKGWKIVLSKAIASGSKPLHSLSIACVVIVWVKFF